MERLTNSGTKEAKSNVTIREVIKKLAEYEDLEEQGKLLKLPCMYGEEVFVIPTKENILSKIAKMKCFGFCIGEPNNTVNLFPIGGQDVSVKLYQPDFADFGKSVFLTREAAEAALKNMCKK